MNYRKNLIFASLACAGLAAVCRFALTSADTAKSPAHQDTEAARPFLSEQTAKPVPPIKHSLQIAGNALPVKATQQAKVTRREKSARAIRIRDRQPAQHSAMAGGVPSPPMMSAAAGTQKAREGQAMEPSLQARPVSPQEARDALREVGTNIEAEAVWMAAISDPNMPVSERKNLIEDLNEEGFADPKHLTSADLPRIESRLTLIEELAPEAMDQTNADAFEEAYKDLSNMYNRLMKP